jgi:hypothetical protein
MARGAPALRCQGEKSEREEREEGHHGSMLSKIKCWRMEIATRSRNQQYILTRRRGTGGATRVPGKERGRARRGWGGALLGDRHGG